MWWPFAPNLPPPSAPPTPFVLPSPVIVRDDQPPRWTVAAEWQRLDTVAGLCLQTGLTALVAAATFVTASRDGRVQGVLLVAVVTSFLSVLTAVLALGKEAPDRGDDISTKPDDYEAKKRLTNTALGALVIGVQFSTVMSLLVIKFG